MSNAYPILRSLDPYHARIGYLGALASVATRGLDRQDALMARYHDLLFEKIFPDDERYELLMQRVDPSRQPELHKQRVRPESEDPAAGFTEPQGQPQERPPADWLLTPRPKRPAPKLVTSDWLYVSEFWLFDSVMPSPLGHLPKEKTRRTLELARATSVLLPTLELSETGYLMQHLLAKAQKQQGLDGCLFNRINPDAHPCLRSLYFRSMLRYERLFPFLIAELVERDPKELVTRGEGGLLVLSVERMLREIGEVTDPEHALELRDVTEFQNSISPPKDSTQENYLRPRLEILVDLGLLERRSGRGGKRTDFMWRASDRTRALADALDPLRKSGGRVDLFLDNQFFRSWSTIFGRTSRVVGTDDERLLWFVRAFQEIGREFGFTPGRTLALKACLIAWEAGLTMEVSEVFKAVYGAAQSRWAPFLRFSGGSRFDSEFLIRVDEAMIQELERVMAESTPR